MIESPAPNSPKTTRVVFTSLVLAFVAFMGQVGCVNLAAQMLYVLKGNQVPAKCTALDEKRVAVVCVSVSEGLLGSQGEGDSLARLVAANLGQNVKKIQIVPPDQVSAWRDANNWDELDFRSIGRGLKADMVVAINLGSYSIHENPTLLRGRANVTTLVYDMKDDGKVVYRSGPKEFAYPENGGRSITESEANFRSLFSNMLARDIAKNFYPYEAVDDVAKDSAFMSG